MVAMGRPRQEARRIARKKLSERVSDVVRECVLFDAIPDAEQPVAAGLENPFRLHIRERGREKTSRQTGSRLHRMRYRRTARSAHLSAARSSGRPRLGVRSLTQHRRLRSVTT